MAKILIVGSVARDDVVFLEHPLVPGAHLEGSPQGNRLGGGGANTAVALAGAGHQAVLVTPVGGDGLAGELVSELESAAVDISQLIRVEGPSTRSLVMIDGAGERTIVNLTRAREPGPPVRLLKVTADCLYVRSRSLDLAEVLTAKTASCRIVAHMPPLDPGCRPAHVLVASESDLEAKALVRPFETGRKVAGELLEWVVITHGPKGATAFGRDGAVIEASAPAVDVLDTTGAGDAFAAGLVHGLVSGRTMERAVATGCAWGGEAVRWESSALPIEAVRDLVSRDGAGGSV